MVKTLLREESTMPGIRISLTTSTSSMLHEMVRTAQQREDLRTVRRVSSVLAVANGYPPLVIASIRANGMSSVLFKCLHASASPGDMPM
jgi:hypothetical protein